MYTNTAFGRNVSSVKYRCSLPPQQPPWTTLDKNLLSLFHIGDPRNRVERYGHREVGLSGEDYEPKLLGFLVFGTIVNVVGVHPYRLAANRCRRQQRQTFRHSRQTSDSSVLFAGKAWTGGEINKGSKYHDRESH